MNPDLRRVIRIVFEGDNDTQRAFSQLDQSLKGMETSIRSVTGPMADIADATLKAQAALIALATGGIALVVTEAGRWSDSFNEISTLIDATDSDLEQFKRQVLDYGASAAFALDDVNSAIYAAISAGIDYRDVLTLMADAERLAIAGKAELGETTVALASVLNAYGESADQAGRYSDIFFETVRQGQTTLPELAHSLANVTSLAAAADVPFETVTSALAAMTAQGMPTEQAITALRGAIQTIIRPTGDAANLAAELGIEFNASALASRGLEGVLQDVYRATGGNVEEMARLFTNVRGLTGVLSLFGQDGGDNFLRILGDMRDSAGATDVAYDRMKDNISLANQTLINSMRATFITAGLPILDDFASAVGSLSGIFDGLRLGIDAGVFDPLYEAFSDVVRKVTEFANDVGMALPEALALVDWSKMLEGFENLADSLGGIFQALFRDLDPRNVEDLAQIIQVLADGVGSLANVSAGVIKEWRPIVEMAGELIVRFSELSQRSAEASGSLLGTAQKAEFLWGRLGFVKGTLALVGMEMMSAEENTSALGHSLEWALNPFGKVMDISQGLADRLFGLGRSAEETELDLRKLGEGIESLPDEKDFKLNLDEATWNTLDQELGELMQGVDIPVSANTDTLTFRTLEEELDLLAAGVDIPADLDPEDRVPRKAADIETQLEWDAKVEIANVERDMERIKADAAIIQTEMEWQAKIDIAEIEAKAAIIRDKIEWQAKLDIAEVRANADIVISLAESIGAAWSATGESIAAGYSALADPDLDPRRFERIVNLIRRELNQRDTLLGMQRDLVRSQTAYMDAKTAALQEGQGLIQIDGAGLQPHLEAFMWEVLEAIQVRVNEEGLDMLLNTPGEITI